MRVTITAEEVVSSEDYGDPSKVKSLTSSDVIVHLNDEMLDPD